MKFGNRKNPTERQATVVQAQGAPEAGPQSEVEKDSADAKVAPSEAVTEPSDAPQTATPVETPAS